jgi:hypothetical protein
LWNPEYCREQVAGVEITFGEGVLLELGKREGHQHSNAFLLRQQEAQVFNLHRANGLPAKLVSRSNKQRGISGWTSPSIVFYLLQGKIFLELRVSGHRSSFDIAPTCLHPPMATEQWK